MKRRDFLKNMLYTGLGASLAGGWLTAKMAEAAWNVEGDGKGIDSLLNIPIRETNLEFLELENRRLTDAIVVHHIGGTNSDVSAADVHEWHLNNGWAGIGYHFVIRKDGTIERGRPMNMEGAHCEGHNWHTVGVNVVGEFENHEPTAAQISSLVTLLAALCRYYSLSPTRRTIKGHRELNATLCPGDNLYYQLTAIVEKVQSQY